jgi:thioredoxin-related protein
MQAAVYRIPYRAATAPLSRRCVLALAFGAIAATPALSSGLHKLVMVEEPGCIYCARWHAEVGPAYANSPEGRFAPLQRVRIGAAEINHLQGLRYTPTFVLVEGEREIGRITGYPGADFFWGMLAALLAKTSYDRQGVEEIKT